MLKYDFIVESIYEMYERQGDNSETEEAYAERSARHEKALDVICSAFSGKYCKVEHSGYWTNEKVNIWGITFQCDYDDVSFDVQHLAIKDGCDYVRFEDGSYGIIAYYNGHDDVLRYSAPSNEELKEWGF